MIDDDDMGPLDYAFLNDGVAQGKLADTLAMADVRSEDYAAVYFVGGKGAMWDFPDNTHVHQLVRDFVADNKLIGAVCHGPAALANVQLETGQPFLQGRAGP